MNRFQGMNSASLCSLEGRYDYPIPTRFLAPIDCLKIPTQNVTAYCLTLSVAGSILPVFAGEGAVSAKATFTIGFLHSYSFSDDSNTY
jgi:hypothetical protein